jgi:thymidylate kinase
MFSCALIGPDGAGKSTLCAALPDALPFAVHRIYMGVNPDAGNHQLPTTWLVRRIRRALGIAKPAGGPPTLRSADRVPSRGLDRFRREARSTLWLVNRLTEEWYRQALAWYFQWRGHLVLFDRHYIADYHAHDMRAGVPGQTLARRVHGFVLRRFYPRPDLVVVLDAPPELLFARKSEGTLQDLERRHAEYRSLDTVFPNVVTIDASQSPEGVLADVVEEIVDYHERERGARVLTGSERVG